MVGTPEGRPKEDEEGETAPDITCVEDPEVVEEMERGADEDGGLPGFEELILLPVEITGDVCFGGDRASHRLLPEEALWDAVLRFIELIGQSEGVAGGGPIIEQEEGGDCAEDGEGGEKGREEGLENGMANGE